MNTESILGCGLDLNKILQLSVIVVLKNFLQLMRLVCIQLSTFCDSTSVHIGVDTSISLFGPSRCNGIDSTHANFHIHSFDF